MAFLRYDSRNGRSGWRSYAQSVGMAVEGGGLTYDSRNGRSGWRSYAQSVGMAVEGGGLTL